MRNTVAITSQNIAPLEKMSMQRQNTSINDGNRKRGKNSDANCHSAITTMNGKTDDQTLLAIARISSTRWVEMQSAAPYRSFPALDRSWSATDPTGRKAIDLPAA